MENIQQEVTEILNVFVISFVTLGASVKYIEGYS